MSNSSSAAVMERDYPPLSCGLHHLAITGQQKEEEEEFRRRIPTAYPGYLLSASMSRVIVRVYAATAAIVLILAQSADALAPASTYCLGGGGVVGIIRPVRFQANDVFSLVALEATRKRNKAANGFGGTSSSASDAKRKSVKSASSGQQQQQRQLRARQGTLPQKSSTAVPQHNGVNASLAVPPPTKAKKSQQSDHQEGKSVFRHFRPRYAAYASSPLEIISPPSATSSERIQKDGAKNSKPKEKNSKKKDSSLTRKIARLLNDDDDDGDASEESANEVADLAAFSRMSDEAKLRATRAVNRADAESDDDSDDDLDMSDDFIKRRKEVLAAAAKGRKVRASVKETGSDTIRQYVKSMGQHDLLTQEDEIVLGRQVQILVRWENERQKLEEKLLRAPTFAQWAEAVNTTVPELKKQIRRSQRAKAAMVEANLRLVVSVARQTVKRGRTEINFQDTCQEGIIGLTRAAEKFDPELGFRFSTYAIWWIKKEVHRNVSNQSRQVRLPAGAIKKINDIRITERVLLDELGRKPRDIEIADRVGITLEQLDFYRNSAKEAISLDKKLEAKKGKGSSASGGDSGGGKTIELLVKDPSQNPTELASSQMLKDDVRRLIRTLSPREQAVIRLRFGLDDGTPRTLDDIGKKFSVEKERIRKIEARALLKLRQPYRNQSVKCYISDL